MLGILLSVCISTVTAQTDFYMDTDETELITGNSTVFGEYLGGPCQNSCNSQLTHVYCDQETLRCECETKFPVRLGPSKGCAKPAGLGEQCFYFQSCLFMDQNSDCVQISHNAVCQCKDGYHTVTVQRPTKRVFCSQDLVVLTSDMSTLLGVATGLAIFTALICFVLKLFVGARPRHYANANNLSEPILFASQTGMPVSVLRGGFTREYSSRGSRGVLVPPSRAGAARAAAILLISCHLSPSHDITCARPASVHSSTSSTKSFSARQFERERENRLNAARARERDKETSPSPRSTENLLDEPTPSESWPKTEAAIENSLVDPEGLLQSETNSYKELTDLQPSSPLKKDIVEEEGAAYHNNVCDSNSEDWSDKP